MISRYMKHITDKTVAYKFYLENFIISIMDNPYLKNSEQIIEFLNSDKEQFVKKIEEINKKTSFKVN